MKQIIDLFKLMAVPLSKLFEWLSGRKQAKNETITNLEAVLQKYEATNASLYEKIRDLQEQSTKTYEELLAVKRESARREHELLKRIETLQNKVDSYEAIILKLNQNETNA